MPNPNNEASIDVPAKRSNFDPLDLLLAVAMRKRLILITTGVVTVLAAIVTLFIKNTYEATTVILPPRQEQSMSALISGQLGSIAALSGGGGMGSAALSLKSPNEIYSQLLLSRAVGTRLINLYNLKVRFQEKTEGDTLKALAKHTRIDLDKSNLIRITVSTHDAVFSSQLANAYVDQLHDLNTTLALTESSQRRIFYQQQLDQQKVVLADAEADFQQMQKRTGLVQLNGQAEIASRSIESIRSEISVRSAQLQSLSLSDTQENPEYQRLRSEVSSLQAELVALENSNKSFTPGDIEIPTAKLPESLTEYTRTLRELRLQENVYDLLVKQFEAAKIDEAKTAPLIQVVDRAVPPERKSGPPRLLITLGACIATFLIMVLWSLTSYIWGILRRDVYTGPKLDLLKNITLGRN